MKLPIFKSFILNKGKSINRWKSDQTRKSDWKLLMFIIKAQQRDYFFYPSTNPDNKCVLEEETRKALKKYYCDNPMKTVFSS